MPANLYRYLRNDAGDWNANGAPGVFRIAPASNEIYKVRRLIGFLEWFGAANSNGYGAMPQLSNGIQVGVYNSAGLVLDLLDGISVTRHNAWKRVCYDVEQRTFPGTWTAFSFRWSFFKAHEDGLRLNGRRGEYLAVAIDDQMSGIAGHSFQAQGERRARFLGL